MSVLYYLSKVIKKIQLPSIKNSKIDKFARILSGSNCVELSLGKYSYIGNYCTIVNTNIGKFCSIADNCIIGGSNHPINWVSTSPIFHNGKNIFKKNFSNHSFEKTKKTFIGNDVWIGSNCLIKSGIKIGSGAIIGMGSVVTKDVGDYEIWAGNPAKIIRKRFDTEKINLLLKIKWWDYQHDLLIELAKNINDIDTFLKKEKTNR